MSPQDPLTLPKEALAAITKQISLANSPVGIDASYTHALIITYLQQINQRLDKIEAKLHN